MSFYERCGAFLIDVEQIQRVEVVDGGGLELTLFKSYDLFAPACEDSVSDMVQGVFLDAEHVRESAYFSRFTNDRAVVDLNNIGSILKEMASTATPIKPVTGRKVRA